MNLDPLEVAIRHISETRRLVETLVTSSETFNYPGAKRAIAELQRKTRELAKLQATLQGANAPAAANIVPLRSWN